MAGIWNRFNPRFSWAYLKEVALAGASYGLIALFIRDEIVHFIELTNHLWIILTTTMFVGGLAIWAAYVSMVADEFGEWLHSKGKLSVYFMGFLAGTVVFFITTCMLISISGTKASWVRDCSCFFMIYSLINLFTLIKNAMELVLLHAEFRIMLKEALKELHSKNHRE